MCKYTCVGVHEYTWVVSGIQLCHAFASYRLRPSPTFNVDAFGPENMLKMRKSATYSVDISVIFYSCSRKILTGMYSLVWEDKA